MFYNQRSKSNYHAGSRYQNSYGWKYRPKYGPMPENKSLVIKSENLESTNIDKNKEVPVK